MFSLRIVSTSHYQADPLQDLDVLYSTFRSTDVHKVPILRIFGATPAGQKTCMHVHGVFPYLYVPYDGTQPADSYMRRFAASLDKAINVANNSNANKQHVFKISLVSGIPMYGYHGEEQQFLKIYLYNPNSVRKAADLLLGGAVMNKSFQPHEAHIPFPLQLFIDYNLYGMNLINVAAVKFRRSRKGDGNAESSKVGRSPGSSNSTPGSSQGDDRSRHINTPTLLRTPSTGSGSGNTPSVTYWDPDNISSEMLLPENVERQSLCELEVDIVAADILNRREVTDNMGSNPGLAALWEDERQRRRDAGQTSQITPPESQEHHHVESSESERELLERLAEIVRQQRVLSRSESEESSVSMEDTTLTPENMACIPASQLEDHSQSALDSQASMQSSQDTVILAGEERAREGGEEDGEDGPVISLESIQRVVSFSQSFSRSDSQPSSTPQDGEAADQSLLDVLAALAEESSPTSSQRSAAQIAALEDQDSVMGQEVALPPDDVALQEDEEETLHMSQALPPETAQEEDENFDLEGLDATWNGSPKEEKDEDCAMESDDRYEDEEDDDDDIPQLDGTSDEKPASKKSSKKRLGVRGPVTTSGSDGTASEGSTSQGEPSTSSSPLVQNPSMQGGVGQPPGVTSPHHQPQAGMEQQQQQQQQGGGYYGHQQWGDGGGGGPPTNMGGMYPGWGQSHPPQGSYPNMYRPPNSSGYGYYSSYPQRYPYNPSIRQGGPQRQATFSPPPRSPMSPPTYPNSGTFQPGSSPQQYPFQQHPHSMTAMRRHSEGSLGLHGGQFSGQPGWQYPAQGYNSSAAGHQMPGSSPQAMPVGSPHGMQAGASHAMSPESWSPSYSAGASPLHNQNNQNPMGMGQFNYPSPAGSSQQNSDQNQAATTSVQTPTESVNARKSSESQSQPSTLQALLEAPESSRVTHAQYSAATFHRRAMSMDCSPLDAQVSSAARSGSAGKGRPEFKHPEKRSGSFSSPGGTMGQSSALSSLYNFVSNVDPMARTPTPTSRNSTPTPSTPSSTPTSGPSPSVTTKEEESLGVMDMGMSQVKRQLQQPPVRPPVRSMSVDEGTSARAVPVPPTVSPMGFSSKEQTVNSGKQETNSSLSEVPATTSGSTNRAADRLGKQSRMKKLGLNLQRTRQLSEDSALSPPVTPTPCPAYTFTFHVPTPVYKRFKMRGVFPFRETADIKVVRMHPMDARRYSLLKIGRELVRIRRLSPRELRNVRAAFPTQGSSTSSEDHHSLIDPHTGELLSSVSAHPAVDDSGMQASQEPGKAGRQGGSRRLMGPKCKRVQSTADGSCQTGTHVGVRVKNEVGQGMGSGNGPGMQGFSSGILPPGGSSVPMTSSQAMNSGHTMNMVGPMGSHELMNCGPPMNSGQPMTSSQSMNSEVSVNSAQAMNSGQPMGNGGDGSKSSWQTMDRDRRPSVKVEYPAQRPFDSGQWPGGQPPSESWGQGSSVNSNAAGQWGEQWSGRSCPPGWNPNTSQPFNYPSGMDSAGSKQQFPYNTWSRSSSGTQSVTSPSSVSQPGQAVQSSPNQGGMGSPSFPQPYPQNFSGYSPGHYNQQAGYSPSGHQNSPKYPGYPNMSPGRFPYPGVSPQHGYPAGQSPGHSAFPPGHPSPAYPSPGSGKDGFLSPHPQQQQQGGMQGQYQQQSQYMPPPNNPAGFQPNGGFSPQAEFSPNPNNPGQFSAGGPHPMQQFSSPAGPQGQFSGEFSSPSGHPGQFPSTSGHFGSPSGQPGQFSPTNQLGQFSPHVSMGSHMSLQGGYQGQFSPSTSQQNQFFPTGSQQSPLPVSSSQQNSYPQYSSTEQFPQGTNAAPNSTTAQSNSSTQNNGNGHFLDTANQGNPFLRQGACQASTSKAGDPVPPPTGHSGENMQSDRPTTADSSDSLETKGKGKEKRAKASKSKTSSVVKKSDASVDSDDDFRSTSSNSKGQKKSQSRRGSKSSDSSASNKQNSGKKSAAPQASRRSSVQLWSDGDSDSLDDSDESDESSDDYRPSNSKWRGQKRKGNRELSESRPKRTKRSSVNYKARSLTRNADNQAGKKTPRRGRPPKNHKNKKRKQSPLIEGVHYIVVGKFKGHKVMLVKVDKVKVALDERVKVSEWHGSKEQGQAKKAKTKGRLLGPRCRRLARGNPANDPCFVQASDPKEDGGELSDASTIVEGDLGSKHSSQLDCPEDKPETELVTTHVRENSDMNDSGKDGGHPSQNGPKVGGESKAEQLKQIACDASNKSGKKEIVEGNQGENAEGLESSKNEMDAEDSKKDEMCVQKPKAKADSNKDEKGVLQLKKSEKVASCVETNSSKTNKTAGGTSEHKTSEKQEHNCHHCSRSPSPCPPPQIPKPPSQEGATDQDTTVLLTMEVDAESKAAASEPPSRTQSPVAKPGKRPSDTPSIVSEHSQDADCSSLPHSNPDSASSSPVPPCISLTASSSLGNDPKPHYQLKPEARLLDKERGRRESNCSSPDPLCLQTVRERGKKKVRPKHQELEPSSDSSDSHACFSEVRAVRDHSPQSGGFSWKENLTSVTSAKPAEADKDKLKKQKTLTTNQRLGVAFLSKRSRRRKSKVKTASRRSEGGGGVGGAANKVMDSLSLLHMATLASFGGDHNSNSYNNNPSSPAKDEAEEKENHNLGTLECAAEEGAEWKTFSFSKDSAWKMGVHTTVDVGCELFKKVCNPERNSGSCEVENDSVYKEERKFISGTSEMPADDASLDNSISFTGYSVDQETSLGDEEKAETSCSQEKTQKNTSRVVKRNASRQMRGYRRKRVKKSGSRKSGYSIPNKLLDSLDMLHTATLVSLGTDPPKADQSDTSLPRYCDLASDHTDKYEESLIKMAYTSPVHSDLGDLSPPIPLSPEELTKQNKSVEQRRRPVPCRLQLDENPGTRTVRMAQIRAEHAAKLSARKLMPLSPNKQVFRSNSESEGSIIGDTPPSKKGSGLKLLSPSVSLPGYGRNPPPSASLVSNGHPQFFPKSPRSTQPAIPDPDKLPTPSIPWNRPLHVITDSIDGEMWKDRVIHDALKEKYPTSNGVLGREAPHSLGSQPADIQMGEKASPILRIAQREAVPNFVPKISPLPYISPRELQRNGENKRTPPNSGLPLRESYSHVNEMVPQISSVRHRDAQRMADRAPPSAGAPFRQLYNQIEERPPVFRISQRDTQQGHEKTPPASGPLSREIYDHVNKRTPPAASISSRDSYDMKGKTPPYLGLSNRDVRDVSSKFPPSYNDPNRSVHSVVDKPPPYSKAYLRESDSALSNVDPSDKVPPHFSAMQKGSRFGDTVPPASSHSSQWPSERSNTGSQTSAPGSGSDHPMMSQSQTQRSPRDLGLSRTEMIISQMFNLESASPAVGKSPPSAPLSKSPARSVRHLSGDSVDGDKIRWKQHLSQESDFSKEVPEYRYGQMSGTSRSPAAFSPGRSPAKSSAFFPDRLPSNQKSPAFVGTDGYLASGKSPPAYGQCNLRSPSVYSENYPNSASKPSNFSGKARTENSATTPSSFVDKPSSYRLPFVYPDKYRRTVEKPPPSYFDPSAHRDQSKSPSAYSRYYSVSKSPGAYSAGSGSNKSPSYSHEPYSKSPVAHSNESFNGTRKFSCSLTPEKYSCSPRTFGHTPEKPQSVKRTSFEGEENVPNSKSPVASPPGSVFNGSSKSPGSSRSPRQPSDRDLENVRQARTDSWLQQNRKRSVGEYLEEVIESTYAEMIPRKGGDYGKNTSEKLVSPQVAGYQQQMPKALPGDTNVALDLSACYKKPDTVHTSAHYSPASTKLVSSSSQDIPPISQHFAAASKQEQHPFAGQPVPSSQFIPSRLGSQHHLSTDQQTPSMEQHYLSSDQHLPTSRPHQQTSEQQVLSGQQLQSSGQHLSFSRQHLPSSASSGAFITSTASQPTVCTTTASFTHPTWTSIKTDNFENITDDEDEDLIPSSQEYSTSAYRFPGFRRLSSVSSSWSSPYTSGSQALASTPSKAGGLTLSRHEEVVKPSLPEQRYPSSVYRYSHGGPTPASSMKETASVGYKGTATNTSTDSCEKHGSFSEATTSSQPASQSLVTSFGTPWRDTQQQSSGPTATPMPRFEPITDSEEEEEDGKLGEDRSAKYRAPYLSSGYSSAGFFPAYSSSKAASSYTSSGRPAAELSGSRYQGYNPDCSSRWQYSSNSQQNYGYSTPVSSNHLTPVSGTNVNTSVAATGNPADSIPAQSLADASQIGTGPYKCAADGGDNNDDGCPEDGAGRRKKRIGGTPPSDPPPSSSSSSSASSSGKGGSYHGGSQESDSSQFDGRGSQDRQAGNLGEGGWGHVLCPRAPPPSRRSVEASAVSVGLSLEPVTRAFCTHPGDLPDRPRELGGRVLRIATNRVTELEEMAPPGDVKGLRAWQSLKAADSRLLSSQPGPAATTFVQRLEKEPQLRFVLAGDGSCVITPVKPPPKRTLVETWLEEKLASVKRASRRVESGEKREEGGSPDADTSLPLDIDVPVDESLGLSLREPGSSDEEEEESMFTRLRNVCREAGDNASRKTPSRDDNSSRGEGASTPKRQRLDSDGILHSTPMRRSSRELFDTGCTPIPAGSEQAEASGTRVGEGQGNVQFVTPKRPPLRRLSTNTESALRHAILTSENRQQSFDGEPSQIDGPTPKNTHGFKVTQQKLQDAKALHKYQFLTVLSMELHVDTRGDLMPDPEMDDIRVIFYAVFDDIPPEKGRRNITGAIVVDKESCDLKGEGTGSSSSPGPSSSRAEVASPGKGKRALLEKCGVEEGLDVTYVQSEADLLKEFIQLVGRLDPDILLGFEVQQLSWGYLLQRAAQLSVNLCSQIARIQGSKRGNRFSAEQDEWGADTSSEIHVEGRIILNLWRVLRHEVTLSIYSYENCAFHILHRRVPTYTFRTLTSWYNHRTHLHRWRVIQHYKERVTGQLAMLDQLDIIGKTSEFARVFGIEFFDVLSRGSQYRVESMMLRLAKPLNFIPVSPSVQQRARQKAAECIPLTLEPQSRFYTDPVVVLDFQSLYPSIMIAYNYCFSTCLGRVQHLAQAQDGPFEFGCTSLNVPPETLRKLHKKVTVSPNGCVFIKSKVRRGILPMMVEEILKTRLMVKKSMKDYKDDKTLHRMLDARQLGLKLIANVTYGYTGASFSGRMPCIEVGDSIVRKARESLERAIHLVEQTPRWQAEVVYGDTDSMFIVLPGRSKDEAFIIGQEIADAVTNIFPKPMKLKFEKVYLPCVLQTKKRYVGFMYETRDQKEPVFDAKGIETVRRDNCGVVSKVLERCIKILFTMRDVSQVRAYLQRQCFKMLSGRVGLHDFVFAKEYRGMMGYKPGACVPALEIAKKRLREDRRSEPRVGERVPYVIVHGSPGLPLIQLVRQPRELLQDPTLRVNVTYYITKQVLPPLERVLSLIGVSVFQWYSDMPKVVRLAPHVAPAQESKQGTISQYFVTSDCLVCERQTKQAVCQSCLNDPQLVAVTLASRSAAWETVHDKLSQVCMTCMGVQDRAQPCVSLDCPVLFRRHLASCDLIRADQHREALHKALAF